MNRSRLIHFGSRGLNRKWRVQSANAIGAAPRGIPGCPLFAASTASIASPRMTLIASFWSSGGAGRTELMLPEVPEARERGKRSEGRGEKCSVSRRSVIEPSLSLFSFPVSLFSPPNRSHPYALSLLCGAPPRRSLRPSLPCCRLAGRLCAAFRSGRSLAHQRAPHPHLERRTLFAARPTN